ncbi:MAG: SGNH/GDSL hydrolase family protein, partial [Bdellovibrionota bacterium]
MSKRLRAFILIVALFLFAEVLLRGLEGSGRGESLLGLQFFEQTPGSGVTPFYRTHFCDPVHFRDSGEELAAQCFARLAPDLFEGRREVWFLGGSTTAGRNCDSTENWVSRLMKKHPNARFRNLAEGGQNSDMTLELLKKTEPKADLVVMADGINEMITFMDDRDPNYASILERHPELREKVSKSKRHLLVENTFIALLRLSKTIYKASYVIRSILNSLKSFIMNNRLLAVKTEIAKILLAPEHERNAKERTLYNDGFLNETT